MESSWNERFGSADGREEKHSPHGTDQRADVRVPTLEQKDKRCADQCCSPVTTMMMFLCSRSFRVLGKPLILLELTRFVKVQQFTKLVPKARATSRKIQCTSADSADIFGCAGTEWSPSIAAVISRSLPLTPICMPGITTHYLRRQDNARSATLDLSLSTSSKDDSDGSNRARCATSPTRAKFGEETSGWKGLLGASLPGRSTWKNALRFAEAVESKKRFQK